MKKTLLSALIISALAATMALAAGRRNNPAYITPAEPGQIFTVIDYPRAQGQAQTAMINANLGGATRSIIAIAPGYQNPCTTATPAGVVLKLRHSNSSPTPLTVATNGTIIRGPYQGDPPAELLHACYKLIS
ncbi:MAG TPA: hypothetical protein VGK45_09600 [Thermoanaerobaculia bacterium]